VGHVERLQVTAGRAYRVDFTLESAPVLSARVEDGSGRPVRGLEILVRPLPRPPWGLTSGGMLDTEQLRLDGTGHFAHGRTDPDGRIALRALGPGTYGVFCAREEWILEHERVLRPGDGEARVTAWPAHAVVGTVRDAATDDPVDRAHVTVVLRTGAGHAWTKSGTVTRGRLWLAWKPAAEETEHGFEAAVSVAAPGYLTRKKLILFPRGTRRRQVSFQLETPPARGFASVLLEVVDSWGKPVDLALLFRTDPASGLAVTPEGPGLYRLRAPPGKRTLRVAPRLRLGRTLEWTGSPEWREGHEALVRCELPAFGIVRVRRPASAGEKKPWLVAADADDGNGGGVFQIEEDEVRFAVVAGLWHFGPEGARRTVTVRPGAEVDVTLGG